MQIIGLTGEKRSGKSTLATGIQNAMPGTAHVEISDIITEVATDFRNAYSSTDGSGVTRANEWLKQLPPILNEKLRLNTTYDDFAFSDQDARKHPAEYRAILGYLSKIDQDFDLLRQPITHETKEYHRELLQALGGAVVAVSPNAWFDEAFQRLERRRTSFTALGILSTVAYSSDAQYVRDHGGIIAKILRSEQPKFGANLDPTDRERSAIEGDITVYNNGSIEQLLEAGKQIVAIVQRGELPSAIVCSEL